jgi:integrase
VGKLTDVELRARIKAQVPVVGRSDGGGLTFTLSKAGAAAWVLRYRTAGRARELTLGRYPDLSLAEARKRAARERSRISDGADPASEKRRDRLAKASAHTFRALTEDYLSRTSLSATTDKETRRYLDKDILPRLGGLSLRDVSAAEIVHLIETIAARSPTVARRAFEMIGAIFAHGIAKHLVKENPCAALKVSAIIGTQERRARLKLDAEELRTLFGSLALLSPENALAVRILLMTAVRKTELIAARWGEIDLDSATWTVPAERTKTRRGFVIPLPAQAVAHFCKLKELAGESEWVFPCRARTHGRRNTHMSRSTLNAALERLAVGSRRFSPHDLRSTARSYLTDELGVTVVVAERILNHALGGLVGVYDKSDYIQERRRALDLWASHLDDIEAGRKAKVTPLRTGTAA